MTYDILLELGADCC